MIKNYLKGSICLFILLLLSGCGNPYGETENGQSDSESQNMVSENVSADIASGNETGEQAGEELSQDMTEEIEVIELSNGLYAYSTSKVTGEYERQGVTGWIMICNWNPEREPFNRENNHKEIMISNVYGTITDIRMNGYAQIIICYDDKEEDGGEAVIPLDFYASEGNVLEPAYGWPTGRLLMLNNAELTNKTDLPTEVWSENFFSGGKEYTAVYSRVSPVYETPYSEFSPTVADYRFAILQGDEVRYEIKLYGMSIEHEEVHFLEDVNGDGLEDFIQINNPGCYQWNAVPYVFVWNPEEETCISGGWIAPEDREDNSIYETVLYDRDTGIFYDASNTERNALYGHDIHDMVIVRGAKYIDGEWRTVYEMYLGKESEDYARETRYDDAGNIISETLYSGDEQYDVINNIYLGCELSLCDFYQDYTVEENIVNEQFSYRRYVRVEE